MTDPKIVLLNLDRSYLVAGSNMTCCAGGLPLQNRFLPGRDGTEEECVKLFRRELMKKLTQGDRETILAFRSATRRYRELERTGTLPLTLLFSGEGNRTSVEVVARALDWFVREGEAKCPTDLEAEAAEKRAGK